jgi:uncharacterized protein DUF5686/carboxypeptidase-like protein
MINNTLLPILYLLLLHPLLYAQQRVTGTVFDANTKEVLPFATVKVAKSGQGIVAGLDGKFEIQLPAATRGEERGKTTTIEVTSLGYQPAKVIVAPATDIKVYMHPQGAELHEVVVRPPYEKIYRILNTTIANKNRNNPDKYDWYQCHVYYKMIVDATMPDSTTRDTSANRQVLKEFLKNQYLLMSETYSIRTWKKPQQLQEDVLASRFSGLKEPMFTSLITDVQPFHAYSDYLSLNSKDYHNPVSRGYREYYKFNLADEIMEGKDTVWILSFRPKGNRANELAGTVYINSNGYAISRIIARADDTMLKMNVRIEQQYEQIPAAGSEPRWFPAQLNYIIDWQLESKSKKTTTTFHMKGNSRIDSVNWDENKDFRFDKTHTVRLTTSADELSDAAWTTIRPQALDKKEVSTYRVADSMGEKIHADRIMAFASKLPEAKVPVGILDFDLKRLFSYNYYEEVRLGLGAQTNEHLVKWLSVGGWAGYGFGDAKWKYGVFGDVYADRYREFVFRAGYTDDINDPGRIHLNHDLDKNYLSYYLLRRVDETKTYTASIKKKLAYWNIDLSGRQQQIFPQYKYALNYEGADHTTFTATEATLSLRYAYAERTAPFYNSYTSLGSKYPIWYGNITSGSLTSGNMEVSYTQALSALSWTKHINRIGNEHFLLEGGKSWSDGPLPLSKLFAGNGYKYDVKSALVDESIYTFGGFMTIYPYEFYTDQFVNFLFRHDFDWKLYKLEDKESLFSSAPNICLQYNMLYGTLNNRAAQQYVAFSVPDNAYHEAGLLLNNLIRLRYGNFYYLTFNMGYFYHLTSSFDAGNGRVVFGAGIEL